MSLARAISPPRHAGAAEPATSLAITRADERVPGALSLAIAAVWLGVALRSMLSGTPMPGLGSDPLAGPAILGIGLLLAVHGLRGLVRREHIEVVEGEVRFTGWRLVGPVRWREPLGNYWGLLWRSRPLAHRYGPRTIYEIDLWHMDPAKTVCLIRTRERHIADARLRHLTALLGLSAFDAGSFGSSAPDARASGALGRRRRGPSLAAG